jgi:hypothetical protein
VGIYDDKLRLQRRYEIDIDTDPDSDLDVAASDPGWITDAIWMENSKHMIYTSSLRSGKGVEFHSSIISNYTVKKVSDFPVPSWDVTFQTLPGWE